MGLEVLRGQQIHHNHPVSMPSIIRVLSVSRVRASASKASFCIVLSQAGLSLICGPLSTSVSLLPLCATCDDDGVINGHKAQLTALLFVVTFDVTKHSGRFLQFSCHIRSLN